MAALAGVVALARRRLLAVTVEGTSMQPTLMERDRVLVRRCAGRSVRVGNIVVIRRPASHPPGLVEPTIAGAWIVKRVAAVTGDVVLPGWLPVTQRAENQRVPAGMLVLLGDNAQTSNDSRHRGFFDADDILGVVLHRLH